MLRRERWIRHSMKKLDCSNFTPTPSKGGDISPSNHLIITSTNLITEATNAKKNYTYTPE